MAPRKTLAQGFRSDRPSLVTYLMAGYPDRVGALQALGVAASSGADVIELGVPYSDALADGPVIQNAATAAQHAAETTGAAFGLAESIALAADFLAGAGDSAPPLALMTYVNPVYHMGFEKAAQAAADAGVAGFIIPDLPPDDPMAEEWLAAAQPRGLETVFLVAPTSTPDRIETVAKAASGFIYVVSSVGITGERAKLAEDLGDLVERVKSARCANTNADIPVAVGFGVSTPEQAAQVGSIADGVVVGSAIVRRQEDLEELGAFIRSLAEAVHGSRRD